MLEDYAAQQLFEKSFQGACKIGAMNMGFATAQARLWGFGRLSCEFDAMASYLKHSAQNFGKPDFNLPETQIGNKRVAVTEEIALSKPFGDLLHFKRDTKRNDPTVLLVAPLSGHYSTLLRGTVEALLPHHDVYITDWKNARDVPMSAGKFDLGDYAQYVEDFIHHLGPHTHVIAVCQPTVPVLAAVARMAERDAPNQPLSLTLMGGPLDTRYAKGDVNRYAEEHTIDWFERNVISEVPMGFAGSRRQVYPGFRQLTAFLGMNPERHAKSQFEMFEHLRRGDGESADKIKAFYKEYLAVLDMTAEFYLDTVKEVFIDHSLPKGELVLDGQRVMPSCIRKTALFTVEGERDDIAPPGQTVAAHRMVNGLPAAQHFHHLQPGAGHYGIFEGSKWRTEVCPRVTHFIRQTAVDNGLINSKIPTNTRSIPPNFWQKSDGVNHPSLAA